MSGIPWPSELLGDLARIAKDALSAAANSPIMMNWILPGLAWLLLAGAALMMFYVVRGIWLTSDFRANWHAADFARTNEQICERQAHERAEYERTLERVPK